MVTNSNDNLLKLASLMIAEIESFFTSMQVGLRHPVSEFSFESDRNAFYVIYSGNGVPLKAGLLLSSNSPQEKSRIVSDVETLGNLGYAASYRLLDLGSELLATQIGRILLEIFGRSLPLSGQIADTATTGAPEIAEPREIEMHEGSAPTVPLEPPPPDARAVILEQFAMLPQKRKRGRPRKEEVLARQALLAAQAAVESGLPMPLPGSEEDVPRRRRGRPRKSEMLPPIESAPIESAPVESAPIESAPVEVAVQTGTLFDVPPAAPAVETPVEQEVTEERAAQIAPAPEYHNGNGHAPAVNGTPVVVAEQEPEEKQPEEKQEEAQLMPEYGGPFDFMPRGLPMTKNQRREARRRELERIRRENGAGPAESTSR